MTAPLPRKRAYHLSGLYAAQRAVAAFGARALPAPDTPLGEALEAWRASLVADVGGDPSTAQRALIDLAVRTRLMLDSIDAYLLGLPSLVDKRHRRLWAVVRERQGLADALARYLGALGLERRAQPVGDLATYLAERAPRCPKVGAEPSAPSPPSSGSSDQGVSDDGRSPTAPPDRQRPPSEEGCARGAPIAVAGAASRTDRPTVTVTADHCGPVADAEEDP